MKRISHLIGILILSACFMACQKEDNGDGVATGKFKKDAAGNCAPVALNGIYRVDSLLSHEQYVDVQVIADNAGTFTVKTDSINGYYFSKTGSIGFGLNTIRLFASGKPVTAGTNRFTVEFGTSICTFDVTVFGSSSGTAIFTLGGSPGSCTGFTSGGTYTSGTATDASNFTNFVVNVTTIGTYNISTNTVNGVKFSGTGTFTTTGLQGVTLKASGTPASGGSFNYMVSVPTGSCTFSVTVTGPTAPPAAFTLGGSPGTCTGAMVAGVYKQSQPLNASNTATINVNVTVVGAYTISTTSNNGITFAGSGVFGATGAQTVVLTGSGTPTSMGSFNHVVNASSGNCSFSVTYAAPPPPAAYTLDCASISANGSYAVGTALTSGNTVTLNANVTTAGQYNLTTTLNGITFSGSGTFAGTGSQPVTLTGTGTPTTSGTNTFTLSSCNFDVTVAAAPVPSDLKWKFTLGGTTYQGDCTASSFGTGDITIYGDPGMWSMSLNNPSGAITTGSYSGSSTSGKNVASWQFNNNYLAAAGVGLTNLSATVTSYDATAGTIQGTFSGTVINLSGSSFTVTNGTFKAQF